MISSVCTRLTYANVMATVAVFLSLGGGAYAISLPANSVGTAQIKNGAVTTAKLAHHAVTTRKLATAAVTNAKLGQAAVSNAKLEAGAVTGAKLATGTVARVNLAPDARGFTTVQHVFKFESANSALAPCPPGTTLVGGGGLITPWTIANGGSLIGSYSSGNGWALTSSKSSDTLNAEALCAS